MITCKMILSYPALFEAKPNLSGIMKFSCSLLVDKKDKAGVAELKAAVAKATEKGQSTIWGGKVPKFRYEPLRDGDAELANGDKDDPVYKGKYFINTSANDQPGVVGPDAKPLMNQTDIYAGCIVRADINAFPYDNGGNKGIGWGLNNIMFVEDGDRLDGRKKAEDAFGDYATESDDSPSEDDLK